MKNVIEVLNGLKKIPLKYKLITLIFLGTLLVIGFQLSPNLYYQDSQFISMSNDLKALSDEYEKNSTAMDVINDEEMSLDSTEDTFDSEFRKLAKLYREVELENKKVLEKQTKNLDKINKLRLPLKYKEFITLKTNSNAKLVALTDKIIKNNKLRHSVIILYLDIRKSYERAWESINNDKYYDQVSLKAKVENETEITDDYLFEAKKLKEQGIVTQGIVTYAEYYKEGLQLYVDSWVNYNGDNSEIVDQAIIKKQKERNVWFENETVIDDWENEILSELRDEINIDYAKVEALDEAAENYFKEHKLNEDKFFWGY